MSYSRNFEIIQSRPLEPIFANQGYNGEKFNIPENFYSEEYSDLVDVLLPIYNEEGGIRIPVQPLTAKPNLSFTKKLKKNELFTVCIPFHRNIATRLVDILMSCGDLEEFQSTALYCRDQVNPYLFNYAFNVALIHRNDTQSISLSPLITSFPEKFILSHTFREILQEAFIMPIDTRTPFEIPLIKATATFGNEEHRMAYFREDIFLNLVYWNWHLMYPADSYSTEVMKKNRRGELFYYFHQQILARYNTERLSGKLSCVLPLNSVREKVPEGYFSKLDAQSIGNAYPPRVKNSILRDLRRSNEHIHMDLYTLERWVDRIMDAIEIGIVINNKGEKISIKNEKGIDILGNIVQSAGLSLNREFYGDLFNTGLLFFAFCHDADYKHLECFGVLADHATMIRDPLFYRWIAFITDIFKLHKYSLPPYSSDELDYPGMILQDLSIEDRVTKEVNQINTFWDHTDVDIGQGLNFTLSGAFFIRPAHLQHNPYNIKLTVNNTLKAEKYITIRVFLAPKRNDRGFPIRFAEQCQLMIEIDRFVKKINPGVNSIKRRSTESFVIQKPYDQAKESQENLICNTGWPAHLLVPRGDEDGMAFDLFAMINDSSEDVVKQHGEYFCKDASSYFGLFRSRYPDARPMGYPFDRKTGAHVEMLSDFIRPNMKTIVISIKHKRVLLNEEQ